jgi:glycosyltransferase involved in cell wall biosynthesis
VQVALAGDGALTGRLAGRPGCLLLGRLADSRAFLCALDAFAFPSHQEALPFAQLEAMAAGCALVASRVGGIPEAVQDGVSGLLVPRGTREAPPRLRRIADDPALASRLGLAARARVAATFPVERMVEGVLAVYRGLDKAGAGPML